MRDRKPDTRSERRLDALRDEAGRTGLARGAGIRPAGAPFPIASAATGYYGVPLLKAPVWTWEVPAYFFVGGAAGAASLIAAIARATGAQPALVRDARLLAAFGAAASAPLLISDLGRPERFLNMLRVFKPQSPMSVGAWTLAAFGGLTAVTAFSSRGATEGTTFGDITGVASAATGLVMMTYTGVLLGVTTIPVWTEHARILPAHFAVSALAAGSAMLELRGHETRALDAIGFTTAIAETAAMISLRSADSQSGATLGAQPVVRTLRAAEILSGPLPFVLRVIGRRSPRARRLAAVSAIAGSLLTRLAWVKAGKESAASSATITTETQ